MNILDLFELAIFQSNKSELGRLKPIVQRISEGKEVGDSHRANTLLRIYDRKFQR